jgi:hypothetical protein
MHATAPALQAESPTWVDACPNLDQPTGVEFLSLLFSTNDEDHINMRLRLKPRMGMSRSAHKKALICISTKVFCVGMEHGKEPLQ